jgi:hypothetical protein
MNKIQIIFLILLIGCTNPSNLTIEDIPDTWVHLTKTDSGFIHETHFDLGGMFLQVENSKSVTLFVDQSTVKFDIEKYDSTNSNSFMCFGEYTFGARLKGEKPQKGKLKFMWVDKEKEIGFWTIEMKEKNVVMKEYFSSRNKMKEYPIIEIGEE